jgi:carbon monoxide dehydrogenase subunit G
MRLLALLLVLLPSLASAAKPTLPALTADDEAKLAAGKLVLRTAHAADGEGSGTITGVIDIDATPAEVWRILLDFEDIPNSSAAVKEATRYRDEAAGAGRAIDMAYMLKVAWVEIRYHVHHDYFAGEQYLLWNLDRGKSNDIVDTTGSFSTWPGSGGRTRFLYRTAINTGRNIPKWVEEDLSESSLKSYIRYVKKKAEE